MAVPSCPSKGSAVGSFNWPPCIAAITSWHIGMFLLTTGNLLSPLYAQSALKVSTDFEGGSAKVIEIDSQNKTIHIAPGGDPNRGWACWWAVRIDNTLLGQPLTLELSASDQPTRNNGQVTAKPLDAGWSMAARASISHDGRRWQPSAPGVREGSRIRYQLSPEGTSLWVAWGPLFTPQHTTELFAEAVSKIPGASQFELARTREDRVIRGLKIRAGEKSSSERPALWIQARQHAWETGSSWVARGFVEWLMARDESARWLTDHAEIVVVPIMDVDNVVTGNGGKEENPRDHNRDWDEAPVFPEVAAAQKQLQQWASQGRLDFFIDLHNPAPRDSRPFFFCGPPELLNDRSRNNRALFLEIANKQISGPLAVESAPRITGPSYHPLWRKISGQWVTDHGNEHTVAVCLETAWNTPQSTTEGYRAVGRQLGEAIAEYLQRRKR
jgi:Zinc carboxypeptidase/Cytosolic carboxypeptidase N-terminal domain